MCLFVNFFCKINIDWPRIPHHNVVMRLNYIWERSIHCRSLFAIFTPLYSSTNQELFEMHVRNQSTRNTIVPRARPSYWSIHCPSLSAIFYLLHGSTNQEVFEKHLCIKSSHYKKYVWFLVTQQKPLCATTKLMLFTVSKDEWNTKEDTGKSLKNALHI